MSRQASDDELDVLLARVRRATAGDAPPALRTVLRVGLAEPRTSGVTRALSLATLSVFALILGAFVAPLFAVTLATVWWILPIAGAAWIVVRAPS